MGAKEDAIQRVLSYLFQHKPRLQTLGVDMIVWEVRIRVAGLNVVPDNELRATVSTWRAVNLPLFDPNAPVPTPPSIADSELVQSVKKAMTTVIGGVDLKRGAGRINIGITGLTAELKSGNVKVAGKVAWTGTLGLEAKAGDFHLTGELSSDRWALRLSYPDDAVIPDLSRVGRVFNEGATALSAVVGATYDFVNLQDATRVKNAVTPHMQGAKNSLDALRGISKAKPYRPNIGISVGSPDPYPGQTGTPQGIQGVITLTVVF